MGEVVPETGSPSAPWAQCTDSAATAAGKDTPTAALSFGASLPVVLCRDWADFWVTLSHFPKEPSSVETQWPNICIAQWCPSLIFEVFFFFKHYFIECIVVVQWTPNFPTCGFPFDLTLFLENLDSCQIEWFLWDYPYHAEPSSFCFLCSVFLSYLGGAGGGGQCWVSYCLLPTLFWNGMSLKLKLILLASLCCWRLQKLLVPFPWCWGYRHVSPHPTDYMGGGDLNSGPCVCTACILPTKLFPSRPVFCVLHSHPPSRGICCLHWRFSDLFFYAFFIVYIFMKWGLRYFSVFFFRACSWKLELCSGLQTQMERSQRRR